MDGVEIRIRFCCENVLFRLWKQAGLKDNLMDAIKLAKICATDVVSGSLWVFARQSHKTLHLMPKS